MQKQKRIIKIAVGQLSPALGNLKTNIEKHIAITQKAVKNGADIIIFPELSLSGYALKDATYDMAITAEDGRIKALLELSHQIAIVLGCVEMGERYELYNSLFYLEDGQVIGRHRKVYLPTYGVFEEDRYFSGGNRFQALSTNLASFGLLICEDVWHATSGLLLALDGAAILIVSANGLTRGVKDADKPENIQAWEMLIRSLAITTTSYIVFANRSGVEDGLIFWGGSEIVRPGGQTLAKANYFDEEILYGQIDLFKLKHARLNATLLSDEKIPMLVDELNRIHDKNKSY